ncbi:hypothetical protein KDL45_08580 [bacterium]|nr:hypothetical protein [bacterium]
MIGKLWKFGPLLAIMVALVVGAFACDIEDAVEDEIKDSVDTDFDEEETVDLEPITVTTDESADDDDDDTSADDDDDTAKLSPEEVEGAGDGIKCDIATANDLINDALGDDADDVNIDSVDITGFRVRYRGADWESDEESIDCDFWLISATFPSKIAAGSVEVTKGSNEFQDYTVTDKMLEFFNHHLDNRDDPFIYCAEDDSDINFLNVEFQFQIDLKIKGEIDI